MPMGAQSTTDSLAHRHIRPATRADAAAIAAIYAPYVLHGTASFEIDPPDADAMADRIAKCLGAGWPWLVLELDGAIQDTPTPPVPGSRRLCPDCGNQHLSG
jgi:hypothetical protein